MRKLTKIKPGQKFNNLTIIEEIEPHVEPSGRKRRRVRTKCSCGNTYDVLLTYVNKGRAKSCLNCYYKESAIKKTKYKIGQCYDMLTITSLSVTKNNHRFAICKCDCGNEITKRTDLLKLNKHNNCGCIPLWKSQGVGEISNSFFYRIKKNASVRDINFNITIEEVWRLFLKQNKECAISGVELEFPANTISSGTASLDRVNSSKDYTIDNIQWIHKDINKMKMELPMNKFLKWVRIINQYQHP